MEARGLLGFCRRRAATATSRFLGDAGSLMAAAKTSSASASNPKAKTRILISTKTLIFSNMVARQ